MQKSRNAINQDKYRERHPNANKEACSKYYQKNKKRILEHKKKKFQEFKAAGYSDKRRMYQRVNCRYRRMAANCDNPLTMVDWEEILTTASNKCLNCGSSEFLTMDHIVPISKGGLHTKSNIQVLCRSCNSSKGAKI